jgi:hypothetical protein
MSSAERLHNDKCEMLNEKRNPRISFSIQFFANTLKFILAPEGHHAFNLLQVYGTTAPEGSKKNKPEDRTSKQKTLNL